MNQIKLIGDGICDDTAAIQAMLDKAGTVVIPDGTYFITHPLIIHDNTHLIVARNAVLKLADHANCSLLDNDGLYRRCTNKNITIEGGIWDGNHDHQEREIIPNEDLPCDYEKYLSNSLLVLMIRLVHTENLTVKNLTFKNPTSYAIHIADTKYFTVENVILDFDLTKLNMDGVHIQGPARFGVIRNIMGNANDDHVALCANGTTRSEVTKGDIEDVDIDGIYCDNGYTGVRLLSRGDAVRNIRIRNIHGQFRFFAVSFTHHYPMHDDLPVLLENIAVSDLYVSKSTGFVPEGQEHSVQKNALVWFESDTHCRNIVIERLYRYERCKDTEAPAVSINGRARVENLTVRSIYQETPGRELLRIQNDAGCEIIE